MNDPLKILVVDDKEENLLVIEAILEDMDVDLVKARSGREAIEASKNHEFALALLDVQMPEMDGYRLAEILRSQEWTADLPFIFISAIYTDYLNVFKGYEEGAFSFILKPFEPKELINKVKLFLSIHYHKKKLNKLNKDLERKNAELSILNSDLDSFTYSVSHDLRAPLRAINSYSDILLNEYEHNEEVEDLLNKININSIKMGELIESLLAFARLGQREVNKGVVKMSSLVNSVIEERRVFCDKKISWHIKSLPDVYADPLLLKQVIVNLISNAIKYSINKEVPEIEIGSVPDEVNSIFYIKDNGAGFNMKYADKLFGVFQRLHKDSDFEGVGVGLAIVQRIIQRHNGKVWAEGETDKGATFYFSVPQNNMKT